MKDASSSSPEIPRSRSNKKTKISPMKWSFLMLAASFCLSVFFNAISETALKNVSIFPAFLILATFVFVGIVFDIFGIATTTATEGPINAMSSKKVPGAREALWLVKNAEKVSSFCNDVVGDICGIMSGSTAAVIVASLSVKEGANALFLSLVITGLVAGITVGGKAFGKGFAIKYGNEIVFFMAKTMRFFNPRKKY